MGKKKRRPICHPALRLAMLRDHLLCKHNKTRPGPTRRILFFFFFFFFFWKWKSIDVWWVNSYHQFMRLLTYATQRCVFAVCLQIFKWDDGMRVEGGMKGNCVCSLVTVDWGSKSGRPRWRIIRSPLCCIVVNNSLIKHDGASISVRPCGTGTQFSNSNWI